MDRSDTPDAKITTSPPTSPLQETEPKKLKMSITTKSDDEEEAAAAIVGTKKLRYKRRKIAIFFGYCGVGYQGMQKNPGAKTIEGDLEEALFHSGAVPEEDRGNSKRYEFARSAQTDKGISALGQVVSGWFYIDPPGLVERLNQILQAQIRIFGYKHVTASFDANKFCDLRRYVYLIPVFALDPSCHRDRASVLASLGSGNELAKCFECSERGREVISSEKKPMEERRFRYNDDPAVWFERLMKRYSGSRSIRKYGTRLDKEDPAVEEAKINLREKKPLERRRFCYGEEEKKRFNRILKLYVGSHNFHNFIKKMEVEDPAALRYIDSFHANTIVTVEGIDFVKCEVVGQSFMRHQIRKMIGMAVAVMRNLAPESLIEAALQTDAYMYVPTAPEVGLYLDECLFASYNQEWKDSHEELSMKAYEEEAEEFKMKFIHSHIASREREKGVVALWLHSLNHRNYPDLEGW